MGYLYFSLRNNITFALYKNDLLECTCCACRQSSQLTGNFALSNVGHGANALVLRSRFGAWTVCRGIKAPPRVPCALHKVAARGAWSAFHGLPKN